MESRVEMIYHNCLTKSIVLESADVIFLAFLKPNPSKPPSSCCGRALAPPLGRDRDHGSARVSPESSAGARECIPRFWELERGWGWALPGARSLLGQRRGACAGGSSSSWVSSCKWKRQLGSVKCFLPELGESTFTSQTC